MFSSVVSMMLNEQRVLFGSVRLTRDRLVFTSVPGKGETINWQELTVFDLQKKEYYSRHIIEDSLWENVSIFFCSAAWLSTTEYVDIEVRYKHLCQRIKVSRSHEPRAQLAIMTLFWPDRELIPAFLSHYTRLGVDRFYFYANTQLNAQDQKELGGMVSGFESKVHFVQFEHPYYHNAQAPSRHYGQMMAINDFLYWSTDFAQFVFFVDLDEFVSLDTPLKLEANCCYSFYTCAAFCQSPIHYKQMGEELSRPLSYSSKMTHIEAQRCKSLFNPKNVAVIGGKMKALSPAPYGDMPIAPHHVPATGVHRPKVILDSTCDTYVSETQGRICHIVNFIEKPRDVSSVIPPGDVRSVVLSKSAQFIFS